MSWTITDYRGEIVVSARINPTDTVELLDLTAALQRRYEKETTNGDRHNLSTVPHGAGTDATRGDTNSGRAAADDGPNYCGDSNK